MISLSSSSSSSSSQSEDSSYPPNAQPSNHILDRDNDVESSIQPANLKIGIIPNSPSKDSLSRESPPVNSATGIFAFNV